MSINSENLTISVPNEEGEICNKNCPYCVSKMTGYIINDYIKMIRNISKVKKVANNAHVNSILFTGKGEPLYGKSFDYLLKLASNFKEFPLELQTNGSLLDEQIISHLHINDFDVIAISVDSPQMMVNIKETIKILKEFGFIVRLTFNLTKILNDYRFSDLLNYSINNNVDQMTLRKIVAPSNNVKDEKVKSWINNNAGDKIFESYQDEALKYVRKNGLFIRRTNFNVDIYDLYGVSFSISEYCIQESNNSKDVRSLIFLEDGHLYTSWGSKASVLF